MARIIVTAEPAASITRSSPEGGGGEVLLNERVDSIHLQDGHAAEQLIERLAWAVTDAEEAESGQAVLAR